jgi:hypothetical protein
LGVSQQAKVAEAGFRVSRTIFRRSGKLPWTSRRLVDEMAQSEGACRAAARMNYQAPNSWKTGHCTFNIHSDRSGFQRERFASAWAIASIPLLQPSSSSCYYYVANEYYFTLR